MSVIISQDLILSASAGEVPPLTHARIMYQNVVPDAEVTASSALAGFEEDAVQGYDTYDRWRPAEIPATIEFRMSSVKTINYILVAAHTLGTSGAAIVPEYSQDDGETWVEASAERIPADDTPLAFLFDDTGANRFRLRITSADNTPAIGVVMAGEALAMQRAIYGGHDPINLSRNTEVRPTRSGGGQWLGRSVVRRGLSTTYSWDNLTAQWYRDNFDPFVEAAITRPFGIAWRPETFPNEVAYAWTEGDIQPSNKGTRDLMSVTMSVTAHDSGGQ